MKELDLHGVRHAKVKRKIIRFIKETKSIRPSLIITGNSIPMKRIVIDTLNEYSIRYEHRDYYNLGSFVIF